MAIKDGFRRTVKINNANRAALTTIKKTHGINTDTKAINRALDFAAKFGERSEQEIALALWFFDKAKERMKPGSDTITLLLPAEAGETPSEMSAPIFHLSRQP